MLPSLSADILDELEVATHQRKEGVIFAAGAFVMKATTGAGALVAGIVIDLSDIQPGSLPGQVEAGALQSLGLFTVVITAGLSFVAFVFNSRIRLGRAHHASLQEQLAARARA